MVRYVFFKKAILPSINDISVSKEDLIFRGQQCPKKIYMNPQIEQKIIH